MHELQLSRELHHRLVSISRASLPNEACGLVGGTAEDGRLTAHSIHPVANVLASPIAFALDGQAMIDAERRIDEAGEQLIGIWHSHPTSSAVPSDTDLADAAVYDPNATMVHLIVSMQGFAPQIRAYRYENPGKDDLRKYWLVRIGS